MDYSIEVGDIVEVIGFGCYDIYGKWAEDHKLLNWCYGKRIAHETGSKKI